MTKFLLNIGRLLAITEKTLEDTSNQVHEILNGIVGPCMTVVGSIGIIYMVIMGVQYAKAESDEKRAEFKTRMINLAIGLIIILILVVLCLAVKWNVVIPEVFGYFVAE